MLKPISFLWLATYNHRKNRLSVLHPFGLLFSSPLTLFKQWFSRNLCPPTLPNNAAKPIMTWTITALYRYVGLGKGIKSITVTEVSQQFSMIQIPWSYFTCNPTGVHCSLHTHSSRPANSDLNCAEKRTRWPPLPWQRVMWYPDCTLPVIPHTCIVHFIHIHQGQQIAIWIVQRSGQDGRRYHGKGSCDTLIIPYL